jgi:hypothetical protein
VQAEKPSGLNRSVTAFDQAIPDSFASKDEAARQRARAGPRGTVAITFRITERILRENPPDGQVNSAMSYKAVINV